MFLDPCGSRIHNTAFLATSKREPEENDPHNEEGGGGVGSAPSLAGWSGSAREERRQPAVQLLPVSIIY
jgi:hypothetical protein